MPAKTQFYNPTNPGTRLRGNPSHILIVNGGTKTMATKRKSKPRASGKKRSVAKVYSSPKKSYKKNPSKKRTGVRRNPAYGWISESFTTAIPIGAGVIGTDLIQGFIPLNWGGPWGKIGLRLLASVGVGFIVRNVPFVGQQNAKLITAGGMAGAIQDAFRLGWGLVGGVLAPAPQQPVVVGAPQAAQLPAGLTEGVGMITYADGLEQLGMIVEDPEVDAWQN